MQNLDLCLKNLIGKDENQAQMAADYLVNNADVELFQMLINKSEFLFDFVIRNIEKRIKNAVNHDNVLNLLKFFDYYSSFYDDLFASILSKHANQDLTDDIFELLEKGSIAQKTYAAKYFAYIPDTVAIELLSKYSFAEDENLAFNSAQALGQMQDDVSFDIALNLLTSKDDFEKLKAVRFFAAYGTNFPLKEIFNAMKESKMPENIAGQVPYMESLINLLNSEYKEDALLVIENIILGLGEILPLSEIFQFEIFEVLNKLISCQNENSIQIAKILLNAYSKFKLFCENQEYIFDENKDTKYEINSVYKLLKNQSEEFWHKQKQLLINGLKDSNENKILSILPVIADYKLSMAIEPLKSLLDSNNEIILCEVLNTLKTLNALDDIDTSVYSEKCKNPNIKAIIENL